MKSIFVQPYTESPFLNCVAPSPTDSTVPEMSEPRVIGNGELVTLWSSRINASHGPTPAAATRTNTSPAFGCGTGNSSISIASIPPNRRITAAFIAHTSGELRNLDARNVQLGLGVNLLARSQCISNVVHSPSVGSSRSSPTPCGPF